MRKLKRRLIDRRANRSYEPAQDLSFDVHWDGDDIRVTAGAVGMLRNHLTELSGKALRLRLELTQWRPPWPGWSGRLGHLPGLRRCEVTTPEAGGMTVDLTVGRPEDVWRLLDAAVQMADPFRAPPAVLSPEIAVKGTPPGWLRHAAPVNPDRFDPERMAIAPSDVAYADGERLARSCRAAMCSGGTGHLRPAGPECFLP